MILKMTHVTVYVINQESALDFYTKKLGFKIKMDVPMGKDARWITLTAPEQPEMEIILFPVTVSGIFPKEVVKSMTDLISSGKIGPGVFSCKDIYATYEELKGKGVEFMKPPTKQFYGTEALFKDDSGNWFSLVSDRVDLPNS